MTSCGNKASSLSANSPSGLWDDVAGSWIVNARKVMATANIPSARLVRRAKSSVGPRIIARRRSPRAGVARGRRRPRRALVDHDRFSRQHSRLPLPFPQPVLVVCRAVDSDHLVMALGIDGVDRHPTEQSALQRAHILDRLADRIGDARTLLHVQ